MHFINRLITFILMLLPTLSLAKSTLPILMTKQAIDNIRYLSDDGKTTYFQNESGEIWHSKNFKNKRLLKLKKRTQYLVYVSNTKKRVVIEADQNFHSSLNFNKLNEIYVGEFDGPEVFKLGNGTKPKLHDNDKWLSFFNPNSKELRFINLENPKETVELILTNKLNPYFRPVSTVVGDYIVYSDINKKGYSALLSYHIKTKQFQPILKTKAAGMKVELCRLGDFLILGEFSLYDLNRGTNISIINTKQDPKLTAPQVIYSSSLSDLGHMKCHPGENKVFFIKSLQEDLSINYKTTEVVSLDIGTGAVKLRSDLDKVTQLVKMDNRLLIPMRGDYYIVSGQKGLENSDFLSTKDFKLIKDNSDLNDFTRIKKLKKKKKRIKKRRKKKRRKKRKKKKKKKKK